METTKEIKKVEEKCIPVVREATALVINNEAGLEVAKNMVRNIRSLMKEVKETFDPIVTKANEAHKAATQGRKKHLEPLEKAKRVVEDTIGKYADKLREEARLAEEKLQEEKRKEVEKISKRMNKHLEGYAEIEDQIKELEDKLAKSETTAVEYEVFEKQLGILIAKRDAKAETIQNNQERVEEVETRQAEAPKVSHVLKGAGGGKQVRIPTVFDKAAFVRAIAEGKIPVALVDVNEGRLKKYVNDFPDERIVGVNIKTDTKVVVR